MVNDVTTALDHRICDCGHAGGSHSNEEFQVYGQCGVHGCVCQIFTMQTNRFAPEALKPTVRIPIQKLLFKPNAVAGMNVLVVMSETYFYRSGVNDGTPIVVKPEGDNFRIQDGRHRVIASMLAGRPDVLAEVEYD